MGDSKPFPPPERRKEIDKILRDVHRGKGRYSSKLRKLHALYDHGLVEECEIRKELRRT